MTQAFQNSTQLEDYAAALLHAAGFVVEKNVRRRTMRQTDQPGQPSKEIFELDALATYYSPDHPPFRVIAEAKSGSWGYPDLFKVLGWMHFIGAQKGLMLVSRQQQEHAEDRVNEQFRDHEVSLLVATGKASDCERLAKLGLGWQVDPMEARHWRLLCTAERSLLHYVRGRRDDCDGARAILDYYKVVNDEVFYEGQSSLRLLRLYQAYEEHPRLSLAVAREIDTGTFDLEDCYGTSSAYGETLRDGRHHLVEAALYVEHRARASILKAAVDYVYDLRQRTIVCESDPDYRLFPKSLQGALITMQEAEQLYCYPYVWQTLVFHFGGFMLEGRRGDESALIANTCHTSPDSINAAFKCYEALFPINGRWLLRIGNTECQQIKLLPMFVKGIGAVRRRQHYRVDRYSELACDGYTATDLSKWHRNLVSLIKGEWIESRTGHSGGRA